MKAARQAEATVSIKTNAGDGGEWRERSATGVSTADVPDFGSFMRQVFPEVPTAAEAVLGGLATTGSQMRRDYDTAFTLLQRASDAFPALLRHCQELEADLRRIRSEAQADVASAHGETQQWQQLAVAMKIHIDESEHQIALMRNRLAAAEERLAAGQTLTKAAEQKASLAIGLTTLFHDKIVEAFGVGSAAHATLDAVAHGTLTGSGDRK